MFGAVPPREFDADSSWMSWGVKQSLREYVTSIEDGRVEWLSPAEENYFPSSQVAGGSRSSELTFAPEGAVHLHAYAGLMNITLREITLSVADGLLRLSVTNDGSGKTVLLAEQNQVEVSHSESAIEITAEVLRLTAPGAALLGGVYPTGTVLDPLRIHIARARKESVA